MLAQLNILQNYELKQLCTLKIGGNADNALIPNSEEEFVNALKFCNENNIEFNIIGAGSNLLISSNGIKGLTIITKNLKKIDLLDNNRIYSDCGVKSASFSKFAQDINLSNAEFLIGIPGSIGGAVYMNAGAHGDNIRNIIESIKVFDFETNSVNILPFEKLYFNYRSSIFSDKKYEILSGIFKLEKGNSKDIKNKMDFHVNYRAEHHPPLSEYSAGSTFRNPPDNYAANLLEKVGAKEYIENGKVRFSTKHANFLYNFNNADSIDVIKLMYKMWDRVYNEFGIKLHPEIKFIGEKTEEEIELWEIMTEL